MRTTRIHPKAGDSAHIPTQTPTSDLDELEKLASLREKGIVTEEEIDAKKRQILDA